MQPMAGAWVTYRGVYYHFLVKVVILPRCGYRFWGLCQLGNGAYGLLRPLRIGFCSHG